MRNLAARLAFVHRTLWARDPAYRWAAMLGPPPLIGGALAALALAALPALFQREPASEQAPAWAQWSPPVPHNDQPYTEAMAAPLPQQDSAGRSVNFQPGWVAEIRPMSVDAAMDVNITASPVANWVVDGPVISLSRIRDAGPPDGLFVGAARTSFVARKAGLYVFSAQLEWSGTQSADCVVRLVSAHHRLIRTVNVNLQAQAVSHYAQTEFRLQPGLLALGVAVGCWRGDHMVAPGTLTVLVRRPGELALTPAAADELLRPVRR